MPEYFTPVHEYTLGKSTVIDTLTVGREGSRPAIVWKRRDGESRITVFKWAVLAEVVALVEEHEAGFITAEYMYVEGARSVDTYGMKRM
ncbi:hypothetical protein [Streptomyces lavendulae]|uniref:hypothetical protein n=1 Tax=Streptomyces lavendulae TaxID=1914 RepID=UPI0033D39703